MQPHMNLFDVEENEFIMKMHKQLVLKIKQQKKSQKVGIRLFRIKQNNTFYSMEIQNDTSNTQVNAESDVKPILIYPKEQPCKICLQPTNEVCNCNCTGSIKYVHEKCLLYWLKVSKKEPITCSNQSAAYQCETCKAVMMVNIEINLIRSDRYKRQFAQFLIMFLGLLMWVGAFVYTLTSVIITVKNQEDSPLYISSMIIFVFDIALIPVFAGGVYYICAYWILGFFYRRQSTLGGLVKKQSAGVKL